MRKATPLLALSALVLLVMIIPTAIEGEDGYARPAQRTGLGPAPGVAMLEGDFDDNGARELLVASQGGIILFTYNDSAIVELDRTNPLNGRITAMTVGDLDGSQTPFLVAVTDLGQVSAYRVHGTFLEPYWDFALAETENGSVALGSVVIFNGGVWLGMPGQLVEVSGTEPDRDRDGMVDDSDRPQGLLVTIPMRDDSDEPTMVSGYFDQLEPQDQLLLSNITGLWVLDQRGWTHVQETYQGNMLGHSLVDADKYHDTIFINDQQLRLLYGGQDNSWQPTIIDGVDPRLAKTTSAGLVIYNGSGVLKTMDGESLDVIASVVLELELMGLAPTPHGVITTTVQGELIGFVKTGEALQEAFRYHPALGGPVRALLYESDTTTDTFLVGGGSGYLYRLDSELNYVKRSSPMAGQIMKIAQGDLDSDGKIDILVLLDQPELKSRLLMILDSDTLEMKVTLDPQDLGLNIIGDLALANLDDDLLLEIAVVEYPYYPLDLTTMHEGRLTILEFNGSAWHLEYRSTSTLQALEPITTGDLDADGRVDIALATSDNTINFFSYSTWEGYQNAFTPIEHQSWTITDMAMEDRDGDAQLELFVANLQGQLTIFDLDRNELRPVWQSAVLHGPVTALNVADWSNNPGKELAFTTDDGELYLYDLDDFLLLYRHDLPSRGAQAMVASGNDLFLGTRAELLVFDILGDEAGKPDLTFDESAFDLVPPEPVQGQPFALTLTVNNRGSLATGATLNLLAGDDPANLTEIASQTTTEDIAAKSSYEFTFDITIEQVGRIYLTAQVFAEEQEPESSNNLAGIGVNVVQPPLPDLLGTSIIVDRKAPHILQNLTFSASIQNSGQAPAAATTAILRILNDERLVDERILDIRPLLPGERRTLRIIWKAATPGIYTFELDIDPQLILIEQDRTNNQLSRTFEIFSWQEVDLSILESDILNTNHHPFIGDLVGHHFTIENLGNLTSQETKLRVRLWYQGAILRSVNWDLASLNASSSSRDYQFYWVPTAEGSYILEIAVDPQGQNRERTTMNNVQLVTVDVSDERQADLTFDQDSMTLQAQMDREGATYLLWVLMENRGETFAPPSQPMMMIDGVLFNVSGFGPQPALFPGQLVWLEAYVELRTPGFHTLTVVADGQDVVAESDEGNNRLTMTVYVNPRDLRPEVKPVSLLPRGAIVPDEPLLMEASITNSGGVSATATLTVTLDDLVVTHELITVANDRTLSFFFNVSLSPGPHLFLVAIDDITPADLDSGNNKLTYTLLVSVPPEEEPTVDPRDPLLAAVPMLGLVGLVGLLSAAGLSMTQWGRNHVRYLPFFLPLYSRIRRDKVLRHATRENLFNHICAHPGEHLRQLAVSVDLPTGTLIHHLGTLEREEYVRGVQEGVYKRFYPCGAGFDIPPASSELGRPQLATLNYLEQHPGASPVEVAQALDMSRQRIHYHLRNLVALGYIKLEKTGPRSVKCYIVENN